MTEIVNIDQFDDISGEVAKKSKLELPGCGKMVRECEHDEDTDCGDFPDLIDDDYHCHFVYNCGHVKHRLFSETTFFCSKECKIKNLALEFN